MACRRARPPPAPPRGDGTARKESIMGPAGQARPSCERYVRSGRDGEEPTKVAGEMSMGMEDLPLPAEAAGRRGMASRSMSWSCRVTMALAAEIRSLAGAVVSSTRSAIRSADRRSRRTICPGREALARLNTTSLLAALFDRLFPSIAGYDFSMYGMTTQCDFRQRFQPMFTALRSRS